jgi:glycosyltransferase involved in cell wall biosynthesis
VTGRNRSTFFSVVVPTRDRPRALARAVRSVLAQTWDQFECIIVDDAGSAPVELPHDERIHRLRREVSGGAGAARNTGCEAASGEFVVFLDDDDVWLPDRLRALADLSRASPTLDILTSDAYVVRGGRRTGRYYRQAIPPIDRQAVDILRRDFVYPAAALRRDRWELVGGFRAWPAAEDYDLWLRCILSGARVGVVPRPLAEYHLHVGSVSSSRDRVYGARIAILEDAIRSHRLSPEQHAAARASIEATLRSRRHEQAVESLRSRSRQAKQHSWSVATDSGVRTRTRAAFAAAAALPSLARVFEDRLARRRGGRQRAE